MAEAWRFRKDAAFTFASGSGTIKPPKYPSKALKERVIEITYAGRSYLPDVAAIREKRRS